MEKTGEDSIQQKCEGCEEELQKQPEEEEEEPVCEARTQMKLTVGDPTDVYEQEAERVAEQVSNNRILSWENNQDLISSINVSKLLGLVEIQGMKISHRDNNDARRLRISMENGSNKEAIVPSSLENRILQSKGKGNPLHSSIRNIIEFQTGYDFSNVMVKTDSESAELNRSLGARAFTNGSDIWLGRNEKTTDIKLMAHELTHVVQQGAAKRISPKRDSIFNKIRSKSKVMGYLQNLVKGGSHDSSVYRKDILQFKKDNSPDRISELQQQILESPGSSSIGLKENSHTLRGCIPGCTPSSTPTCAHPISWTHANPRDHGPDAIRIDIGWQSSTGNLADLGNCDVREVVNYNPIPNPPFLWNPPNPTILNVAGTAGAAMDTHSYPPGLKNGITNPRQAGTMTANQVYQYKCTGPGCTGNWTNFPGQAYRITRRVFGQFVRVNPWRYRITKTGTGAGNTFNYSREVEIPPP